MRDRRPVELAKIALPVLIEFAVVTAFIAAIMAWVIIKATPIPDVLQ